MAKRGEKIPKTKPRAKQAKPGREGGPLPEITLHGSREDGCFVQALMLFPDDVEAREMTFYVFLADAETHGASDEAQRTVSVGCLKSLLNAPSKPERRELYRRSARRARVAGDLLSTMYLMQRFGVPEPSFDKAVFIMKEFAQGTSWKDGARMNRSSRMIRADRDAYRSVAHLWAALRLLEYYPPNANWQPFSSDGLPTLLGVAAEVYRFGATFIPKRQKQTDTFLDDASCWKLPDSVTPLDLPKEARTPDVLLETLQRYRVTR